MTYFLLHPPINTSILSYSGALTDGKDLFRFYRMTRTDHRPINEIPCDEFLFGDFGDPDSGVTSPYSYHIQLSPTLSGMLDQVVVDLYPIVAYSIK